MRAANRNRMWVGLLAFAVAAAATAAPSNKWRLAFSGNAQSDGTIVIRVKPEVGAPMEASIPIVAGTSENLVAKAVVEGLRAQLPEDAFSIERDDGEDVLVKKRYGQPDFDLEIVGNDVENVRIAPRHE
jgi:hypothetical protein